MRIAHEEYLALDLEAHALLKDVPLQDVSIVDLPGGGTERTLADVLQLMNVSRSKPSPPVRALFARYVDGVDSPNDSTLEPTIDDVDLDLLDVLQTLTPRERIERHDWALELVLALRKASIQHYGFDPRAVASASDRQG